MRRPRARLAMVAALIWCGLTRRVRSTAIPLLILAGTALTPTEVSADLITYNVVNYPTLQNGFTVTGTITTDGSTGSALPGSDITAWNIVISNGLGVVTIINPSDSANLSGTFDASPSTISVGSKTNNFILFAGTQTPAIQWENLGNFTLYNAVFGEIPVGWGSRLPSLDSPIATAATVPEPSSAVIASIGAVVAVLAYGWSRHRRLQQHRLEAD
jgi:hypothetical protein